MIVAASANPTIQQCMHCGHIPEGSAKFCGGCGAPSAPQLYQPPTAHSWQSGGGGEPYRYTERYSEPVQAYGQAAPPGTQYGHNYGGAPSVYPAAAGQPGALNQSGYPPTAAPTPPNTAPASGQYPQPVSYQQPYAQALLPNTYAHGHSHDHGHSHSPPFPTPAAGYLTPAVTEVLPANYPGNPRRPFIPLNDSSVPAFAHVQAGASVEANNELRREAAKVMVLLARERLFLYFHWALFIVLNILGCWLSLKCYYEFIGDEMSKTMIACTPFLFINSLALCCLVPIKGTRKEIGRLKERAQHIKFKMEFGHLL